MTALVLGPHLRHVSAHTATIWVETDGPCEVRVTSAEHGVDARSRTFTVHGHHYALVDADGLAAGARIPYEVTLDGVTVWPERQTRFPPSLIRTLDTAGDAAHLVRVVPPLARHPGGVRPGRAQHVRAPARHPRPRPPPGPRLAGRAADGRRPGVRRRAGRPDAHLHPGPPRPRPGARGRAGRLRGVHPPLQAGLARGPGGAVAAVDRADVHHLRRPRHPGRLEHLLHLAPADVVQALVAGPHHRRHRLLLGLPAPREPVPGGARHRPGVRGGPRGVREGRRRFGGARRVRRAGRQGARRRPGGATRTTGAAPASSWSTAAAPAC